MAIPRPIQVHWDLHFGGPCTTQLQLYVMELLLELFLKCVEHLRYTTRSLHLDAVPTWCINQEYGLC